MAAPAVNVVGLDSRRNRGKVEVMDDEEPQDVTATVTVGDDGSISVETSPKPKSETKPSENSFDRNLAEDLDDTALAAIAQWVLDGVEADIQSRRDWEDTANVAAKYLGVKLEEPTTSVSADGTVSKAIASCMLEAAMKLWGTARAELLPVGGPIKVRDDKTTLDDMSEQPQGVAPAQGQLAGGVAANPPAKKPSQDDLADALEADMNHYLTVIDKEYYPDFSKMLMNRALVGVAFRKVYRCPLRRRPVSVWVKAQDLVVSNDCSHLQGAGRITEIIKVRQSTMRRLMVAGAYKDVVLTQPTGQVTSTEIAVAESEGIAAMPQLPSDYEHMVYETRTELGSTAALSFIGDMRQLDADEVGVEPGYPLPYRISIDVDSREVLEIRRNWKQGDQDHHPRRSYVKYGFIPGIGFYDWGLIHLVGNPTQAATMIQRASVDSSLFANFPGGIFLKGPASRQASTVIRPNPGEFIGVDGGGASKVQDAFMPIPYKDASPIALQIQQKFEADVRRLAGVIEIPVGEGRLSNTPVGTIMSYIESVTMVPGAVHKDDHIAQQEEFEMLRELLAEEPEVLTRGNKTPARKQWTMEELLLPDLVPAADPNTASAVHRLMKVQGRVTLAGMPQFQGIPNQRAIWKDAMQVLGGDPDEYTMPEQPAQPPPPPPQVIAAQIRAQSQQQTDQAKMDIAETSANAKTVEAQAEATQRDLDRQSDETKAAMALRGKQLEAEHGTANAQADRDQADVHKAADIATAPVPQPPQGGQTF